MTDPSGANSYTATISVGGGTTGQPNSVPAQVQVKYLLAPSVSEKFNITWAGQTLGGQLSSDGRLQGTSTTQTVNCDQTANTCQVTVPAPGLALIFFTESAFDESTPTSTATFATTVATMSKSFATAIDASALATSNGHSAKDLGQGSTSKGHSGAGKAAGVYPSLAVLIAMLAGVAVLLRSFANQWP